MPYRITLFFTVMLAGLCSCGRGYKEDPSFDEKIALLENHPETFLARADTSRFSQITNEREATDYLLQSLAYNYTISDYDIDKEKMLQCVRIFEKNRKIQQQLEALYLLAEVYRKERNTEKEVGAIERAMSLADQADDAVWQFYLYSYLGDMYFRKYDMLKFVKYQAMANQSIQDLNRNELDINTLTLLGKSYMYIDQPLKAERLLSELSDKVGKQHICYRDIHQLLGTAYFRQQKWTQAIPEFEMALAVKNDTTALFFNYSMLTFCHYRLGNAEQVQYYKDMTARYDMEDVTGLVEVEFYKVCAEIARNNDNYREEARCMQKVIDKYGRMITELNGQTLDGAIQGYMRIQEQKRNDIRIHIYQRILFGMLLLIGVLVFYHLNRRKKQALESLALQHRIDALKGLENIQNETKSLILRDMEIAKQIAMLKHTQKERGDKLLKELDKLDLLKGNKLLTTQWDDFYYHIDLTFDGFYTKLIRRYPSLKEKEVQLCCLMLAGFRTEEIAAVWMQSVFTVHKYKTNVRKKTAAPEAADIVAFLREELESVVN